ncbi:transcriptional-regulating factor 1-like isoform X2 [Acanthopagrus latus]|uniref:transcriptional-regulating factor 1-like isoform X2 n=1 Tax=Acanthopagrus latus TaxID=8177 RepID=UPI00187D05AC|nr:transcriptional-regulating factor 1-like isoform X2 [Acanthopagrus latus]
MSDMWSFSSSSPPPMMHHSSLSQSAPFISSPSSDGNHGNHLSAKLPSYHLIPQNQVSSPHIPESPHHHLPPQVTSPHIVPETQVTSPHLFYQPQQTSPHCGPWSQVTSPHLPHPYVPSPNLFPQPQVTSPHFAPQPQVTSPHFAPQPQVTSPHFAPQPQVSLPPLLSPPLQHLPNQNPDPNLEDPTWSGADLSYSCSYQNQTTAHLDVHLQNQFSTGVTHHTDLSIGSYEQSDTPGLVRDTWRCLGPNRHQLQCSPLGSMSAEVALGRWSSDFSSSPAEDSSSVQFFHNNTPQPFCSPNTPGPSPHYPQTPTISSPGPHVHPREERLDLHVQTSGQLSRDKTLSCCLQDCDGYQMISDQHLLQSQSELIQHQTGLHNTAGNQDSHFSPQGGGQDVSSCTKTSGLPAGLSWREESGGGGGGRGRGRGRGRGGRRGGGAGQPDWNWIKQPKNSTEVLDSRLMCTVCKRDFRSLPALNGHMRSHSGSRPAAWLNKVEDSSPLVPQPVSLVMPVTVPVQSGGPVKVSRSTQRRLRRLSPAGGRSVLYRSLLHRDEEEEEEGGGAHYTPPPMLCPLRAGPGLYCSLTTRRQQRVQTVQLHNTHNGLNDLVAMETASPPPGINKPRINVGRGFQAEIPPLQRCKYAHSDSHNALLLWTPCEELERPVNQLRVEALLTMVRSSVVPGGGASPESALHVLSECRGDFLLTVAKLLSTPETSDNSRDADQQCPSWSAAERRSMIKSLQLHQKDFSKIQKVVQTKSLSQCVEFYYLWKKKLSLSTRTPAGLTVTLPDTNGQRSSRSHDAS